MTAAGGWLCGRSTPRVAARVAQAPAESRGFAGPVDFRQLAVAKAARLGMVAPMSEKASDTRDQANDVPHYHGHRTRLRERFRSAGADALSDYELLEMVLFSVFPRSDVKPLAKLLIKTFGSFAEAIHAPETRLREIAGVGESTITEFKLIAAAAGRIARGQLQQRTLLSSWNDVIDYCRTSMAFAEKEQFRLLFLDKRNQLISDELQQTGTVDHTPVYPRRGDQTRARIIGNRVDPGP